MKTLTAKQNELIAKYEINLTTVKASYKSDWRKNEYVLFAEQELEAVKNGRTW